MNQNGLRVTLVTPDFAANSLGRTYCLWLLGRRLGWNVDVVGIKGNALWPPLAGTDFADACRLADTDADATAAVAGIERRIALSDVVIAVKPLASSFGLARPIAQRQGVPLMVDVDDPDIEVYTTWEPLHRRIPRRLFSHRYRSRSLLRAQVGQHVVTVSNPILQSMYGGTVIPHVRDVPLATAGHNPGDELTVRFVGSPRDHKGVSVLRTAVGRLAAEGFRLGVTDTAPADAKPWEQWYGQTSLHDGLALVATADIVAIPSIAGGYSPAQLPVKLIDAMMFGRPVIASDFGPIRWALDGSGVLVRPSHVDDLTAALRSLRDRSIREKMGTAARQRAVGVFSVAAVAESLGRVVEAVAGGSQHVLEGRTDG